MIEAAFILYHITIVSYISMNFHIVAVVSSLNKTKKNAEGIQNKTKQNRKTWYIA